jgi:RNA polymerase primary sigma factor
LPLADGFRAVHRRRRTVQRVSRADARGVRPLSSTPTADAELAAAGRRVSAPRSASGSALPAFLRAAESYAQLSPAAQNELAAAYQDSLRLKARIAAGELRGRALTLARREVAKGATHLEQLVASNFRLVHLIAREQAARRYPSRDRLMEALPDLVQEGNMALTEAAARFDPARTPEFPKFAAQSVRDRIRYVLAHDTPMKMPSSRSRIQRIARNLQPELARDLGRSPSIEELQRALLEVCLRWAEDRLTATQRKLPPARRHELKMERLKKQGMLAAIADIEQVLTVAQPLGSLDVRVGADGSTAAVDLLADDQGDDLFNGAELGQLRDALMAALASLADRDRRIVLFRYGFVDGEQWTYARIAEQFGVTAERIRQIEQAVLDKLRSPSEQYAALAAHLPSQFD